MSLFSHPSYDAHEAVHLFHDADSGLRCIIAIHSTRLGPAAGGCRVWQYETEDQALSDALRLSRGMTYKNAMAGLKAGGGKAVILAPAEPFDRAALFAAFGRAVDSLGGRYITAEDVGSTVQDMQAVAAQTRYVAGLPVGGLAAAGGDPSPWTALGVFLSIEAAARHKLNRPLDGLRVAVQGLGHVGFDLCRRLHEAGARLIVADLSDQRLLDARDLFQARIETADGIHMADADIFAPCAMGGVLNARTIPQLLAGIVCGAANNQLADAADGARLLDRGVLYCPDYVVNAGGIINVMAEHAGDDTESVRGQVAQIPMRLREILRRAEAARLPTGTVADAMARELAFSAAMSPTDRVQTGLS